MDSGDAPQSDEKILKTPPLVAEILAACVLFIGALVAARYAVSYFVQGDLDRGVAFSGFAVTALGGCFDPINSICFVLPWVWGRVVRSPTYARFAWPFFCVGAALLLGAWLGKHWPF